MANLTEARAAYVKASDALGASNAEIRALTANKSKTVEMVRAAYDRRDAVLAKFNAAKEALDAAEKAAR